MIRRLLSRAIAFFFRSALRFLDQSVSRAMGCFFTCFRVRDDRSAHLAITSKSRTEGLLHRNPLSSLLLSEEDEVSPDSHKGQLQLGTPPIDKGLRDEAKFLKAYGTIPETPIEIRLASENLNGSPSSNDSDFTKYRSWLSSKPINKFELDQLLDQPSSTPIKECEEMGRVSLSSEQTPSSCMTNFQSAESISPSSSGGNEGRSVGTAFRFEAKAEGSLLSSASAWKTDRRNRSVRFESDLKSSSSKSSLENDRASKTPETPGNDSVSKSSPFPTPIKLSDEMQTPGTVFPTNMQSLGSGKPRIRSEYAYFDTIIENTFQLKDQEEHEPSQIDALREGSIQQLEDVNWGLEAGLSPAENDKDQSAPASRSDITELGGTPGDRPIIGLVAAHWNEEENSQISPKWWDGKGIPNSTNKYKEDQKVCWHATPFEERLEKALSAQPSTSQSKDAIVTSRLFDIEENETGLMQLSPESQSKSMISC